VTAPTLGGARVALLEARLESELAALVARLGGVPVSAPAVREAPLDAEPSVRALLGALAAGRVDVVVFQTGVGARLLFDSAERLGRLDELRAALAGATVACRGPKPAAALRERGVRGDVHAPPPYTTAELLDALAAVDVRGRGVAAIAYGEPNDALAGELRARGASEVVTVQLYEWRPPADPGPLEALVGDVIGGRVDAVAFTSQVQVRHLVAAAERGGRRDALVRALGETVVTASVGPTCTAALEAVGVSPHVTADPPKMRPMLTALAERLARRPGQTPPPAAAR
jgi:uroporphyrinogen-III synthase